MQRQINPKEISQLQFLEMPDPSSTIFEISQAALINVLCINLSNALS